MIGSKDLEIIKLSLCQFLEMGKLEAWCLISEAFKYLSGVTHILGRCLIGEVLQYNHINLFNFSRTTVSQTLYNPVFILWPSIWERGYSHHSRVFYCWENYRGFMQKWGLQWYYKRGVSRSTSGTRNKNQGEIIFACFAYVSKQSHRKGISTLELSSCMLKKSLW